jgi:mannose-6-phosphate isomerase-like protein (cupin superfamily)
MKKTFSLIFSAVWLLIFLTSAAVFILSGVYKVEDSKIIKKNTGWTWEMIKSPTRSLDLLEVKLVELLPGKGMAAYIVEAGVDEMFIIQDGKAQFYVANKLKILTKGSVAVIPQGEKVRLRNDGRKVLCFFFFRFKTGSKSAKKMPPFVSVWDTVTFKQTANGGRRNIINQETSAMKNLEIHVTTLKEGLPSHDAHTHADEEIILLRKGIAEESINKISYPVSVGSAVFLTNDDSHGIRNAGKGECEYYAIRWITATGTQTK